MLPYPASMPLSSRTLNHLAERFRGHRKPMTRRVLGVAEIMPAATVGMLPYSVTSMCSVAPGRSWS